MSEGRIGLPVQRGFGETSRRDLWWVQPVAVALGLSAFIAYSTWAAFQGKNYFLDKNGANYLSPFYSPELFRPRPVASNPAGAEPVRPSPHAWFGEMPNWIPGIVTPALLILWMPGGFRFTCYYYRGAYYKAFWLDPANCAVGEPRKSYWGENWFPLIFQNVHRYFLYIAIIFIVLLFIDFVHGCLFRDEAGALHFGIGVGTLVLLMNVILLGGYTFGCHSLRHLIGGYRDDLSRVPTQKRVYDCVSCLNRRHMLWAWCSLFWVGFTDFYIRMCAAGYWTDWRIV
jgi:hypothetical protein